MNPEKARDSLRQLFADYAASIDDDRLEDWVDFFTEDAVYEIIPRENHERGLPITLLLCDGKDMIRDRVVSLREANIYNIHRDRHVVGEPRIMESDDGRYRTETSYALFQTNQDGESRIFSVGRYNALVSFAGGRPLIERLTVVTDTASVKTLLSTPI